MNRYKHKIEQDMVKVNDMNEDTRKRIVSEDYFAGYANFPFECNSKAKNLSYVIVVCLIGVVFSMFVWTVLYGALKMMLCETGLFVDFMGSFISFLISAIFMVFSIWGFEGVAFSDVPNLVAKAKVRKKSNKQIGRCCHSKKEIN